MPKTRQQQEQAFYANHYGQLVGKTIAQIYSDGEMVGLIFTDRTVAWIQRDPEGNGPGFLQIEVKK